MSQIYQPKSKMLQKLAQMDAQPYPIQLNYKKRHDYKSITGGTISCIFYITVMIVVALNLYYFIMQGQLMFQQVIQANNFSQIVLEKSRFGLRIIAHLDNKTQIVVNQQNQYIFGLSVKVEHSNAAAYNPTVRLATNCHNNTYFNFTDYFCFPQSTIQQPFQLKLYGRSDVLDTQPYYRLGWLIYYNQKNDTNNKIIKNGIVYPYYTAQFVFVNNLINPKNPQIIDNQSTRRIYIRDGEPLPTHEMQHINIFLKKLQVQTDTSLLFFQDMKYNDSNYFDQQLIQTILTTDQVLDKKIIWIKLKRSLYTTKYYRKYKKIQTFLAQTFGVIGLASFIFLIYKGYNKWCFTEKQLVPQNQRQQTSIIRYYVYILKNIRKISLSSQLYSDFQQNLDINRILKRIDRLQQKNNINQPPIINNNRQSYNTQRLSSQNINKQSLLSDPR